MKAEKGADLIEQNPISEETSSHQFYTPMITEAIFSKL
jgi:hypothetical protein